MKKYILIIGSLFVLQYFSVSAESPSLEPNLKVSLSPATRPTQKVLPGTKEIELLSILLIPNNHQGNGPILNSITFERRGYEDNREQFIRYKLLYDKVVIARMVLPEGDILKFEDLELWLPDGEIAELRIMGDIAFGNVKGNHTFYLDTADAIELNTPSRITGDFPIVANKILVGNVVKNSPSPECNLRDEPVCGEDGKSYFNMCIPFQKGIRIVDDRACVELPPAPDYCSRIINPVCSDDGVTYRNLCVMEKDNASLYYEGECFPEDFEPIYSLIDAVDLFEKKKNELSHIRPRISDAAETELQYISSLLVSYNFRNSVRFNLISKITDFFNFTRNPSDRKILESEIHNLLVATILAQAKSDQEKYELGLIPFVDVGTEKWYFGAVSFLKENGWAGGYRNNDDIETGQYRPENYVTKAEITKLVFEAKGMNIDYINRKGFRPQNPSAPNSHWASRLVGYAEKNNYDLWNDFPHPDKKATRGEVIRFVFEGFRIIPPENFKKSSFSDVTLSSKNFAYIEYAKQLGIIGGYPDGTFKENEPIIRAEAAKIVKNAYQIFSYSK